MGKSVHMLDVTAAEALGQNLFELLTDPQDHDVAPSVVARNSAGHKWTGSFPVKNKMGKWFSVVATNTPLYDDDGNLVSNICVSCDSQPFKELSVVMDGGEDPDGDSSFSRDRNTVPAKLGLGTQQPLQATGMTNKVKSRMGTGESFFHHEGVSGDSHHSDHGLSDDRREDAMSIGASIPTGDIPQFPFGVFSHVDEGSPEILSTDLGEEAEGNTAIHKIIFSNAKQWMGNRPYHYETSGSGSSVNFSSASSASRCGSTNSNAVNKADMDTDCLDYEILWEDLMIGEQIGQGCCCQGILQARIYRRSEIRYMPLGKRCL